MWKLLKKALSAHDIYSALADVWAFLKFASPFLLAIATMLSGYLQHIPAMWIMAAGFMVFAMSGVGFFHYAKWRLLNSPEYKLQIDRFDFAIGLDPNKRIASLQPIISVRNVGTFPIWFRLEALTWSVANRLPNKNSIAANVGGVVNPRVESKVWANVADVVGLDFAGQVEGQLKIQLKYGRKGKEKYSTSGAWMFKINSELQPGSQVPHVNLQAFDLNETSPVELRG